MLILGTVNEIRLILCEREREREKEPRIKWTYTHPNDGRWLISRGFMVLI